jgi:hypothetical protein
MNYEISVDRFKKIVERYFEEQEKPEGVCKIMIDYNNEFDKIVINIFFDRRFSIKKGEKFTGYRNKIVNQYGYAFLNMFGIKPFLYEHYEDCEELT